MDSLANVSQQHCDFVHGTLAARLGELSDTTKDTAKQVGELKGGYLRVLEMVKGLARSLDTQREEHRWLLRFVMVQLAGVVFMIVKGFFV